MWSKKLFYTRIHIKSDVVNELATKMFKLRRIVKDIITNNASLCPLTTFCGVSLDAVIGAQVIHQVMHEPGQLFCFCVSRATRLQNKFIILNLSCTLTNIKGVQSSCRRYRHYSSVTKYRLSEYRDTRFRFHFKSHFYRWTIQYQQLQLCRKSQSLTHITLCHMSDYRPRVNLRACYRYDI